VTDDAFSLAMTCDTQIHKWRLIIS